MNITELYTDDLEAKKLVNLLFPEYKGNKISVEEFSGPMTLTSYWDSGSKDYWKIINLSNNKYKTIPENGTPFSNDGKIFKISKLPQNIAVVNYHVGRAPSVTFYLNKESLIKMLPQNTDELPWEEKVVLSATRSLKSSYAGIPDYRFQEANRETGIKRDDWLKAKENLIRKGLLNKAGAITLNGRNAIDNTNLWQLKK